MNDDHTLANDKAIERSANAHPSTWTKLKEPVTEGAGVRQAEIRPMFPQQFQQSSIVCQYVHRPGLDFLPGNPRSHVARSQAGPHTV